MLHHSIVDRGSVRAAHARGAAVVAWTVDDRRRARARRRCGSRRGRDQRSDVFSCRSDVYTADVTASGSHAGGRTPRGPALSFGFAAAFALAATAGRRDVVTTAQSTEPPPTTTDRAAPRRSHRSSLRPRTPAPIAFGVTVGGVKVGGLMPSQAPKAVTKVVLAPARARRGRDAQDRARARRARRAPERPEGHSPCAIRAAGSDRPARRRGLAGARPDVRRSPRQRARPQGRRRANRARRREAARRAGAGGPHLEAARAGSRAIRTAFATQQPRTDPARVRDPQAEGRRPPSSTRPS